MTLKAEDVKLLAAGRWIGIHRSVCGLTDHQLNPKTHGPCPRCGGADRFRAMDDVGETGALFCNQCFSTRNGDGFDAIQWLKGCTFAGALKLVSEFLGNHSSQGNGHHKPTVTPVATLERKPVVAIESHFLKFLQAKGRDSIDSLAGELGVSVQSLQALGVGFNPEESVWTFPERTADGIVSGLNRRYPTGEKKMMHGHKRGLYFADNWRELAGPVLIPEGGSDTAAAFTLGLAAIGRPSAIVPRDVLPELVTMLQSVPVDRGIIVVGENDQDHMQDHMPWPGKEGALRTAGELSKALGRSIPYALPPNTTKDLRTWLKSNPAATAHDFVDALTVVQDPEKPNEAAAESSLVFHDAWEAAFKPRPMRECIIEGMLRREEVGNVIASTKTGKSWFALQLLMCVATGRDWLGRRVAGGNVLLIDNELHEETIENRIAAVRDRMDIRHDTPHHDFHYVACRGDFVSLQDLIEQIPKKVSAWLT